MKTPLRTPLAILTAMLVLGGCPRSFNPAAAPVVKSEDPRAQERFSAAEASYASGELQEADGSFDSFITSFPEDPLAPLAQVYRGRIALDQGNLSRARELLNAPAGRAEDDTVGLQARFYLGLTAVRQESYKEGHKLLQPYLKLTAPGDQPPLLAALSLATVRVGHAQEAAWLLDRWHALTRVEAERAVARQQLEALVRGKLTTAHLKALLERAEEGSLLAALCAGRLAGMARADGSTAEAADMLRQAEAARRLHGVDLATGEPGRVGLLVPLSGRFRKAGEQLLAGALEGAVRDGKGEVRLVVRDCGKDPGAAARHLLERERVSALVGTLDPASSGAVAREAAGHGAPFITTSPGAVSVASHAATQFRLFTPNRARVEALASHAFGKVGARKLVILSPAHAFGRAMAKVMSEGASERGARVVAHLTYTPGTHSFADLARKVKKLDFDALFVPDTARALALIAPSLAREGLWAGERNRSREGNTRVYLLLSTADGLGGRELTNSVRYLEGGVVAPGFFPDTAAPVHGPEIQTMTRSLGRAPTPLEAFARDAVSLLRTVQADQILDRAGLLNALRGAALPPGLTGPMAFDASGARTSAPNLYLVKDGAVRLLAP